MNLVRRIALCGSAISLILFGVPAHAQSTSIPTLFAGSSTPLTLALKDLDSSWRVFTLGGDSSGGLGQVLSSVYGGGGNSDLYSKGETISTGEDTYLIAYRAVSPTLDFRSLMGGGRPTVAPLTADTVLHLSLINLHAAASFDDIRQFDLNSELSASQTTSDNLNSIMGGMRTMTTNVVVPSSESSSGNLKKLALAMLEYIQDHNQTFPEDLNDSTALEAKLLPYASSKDIFVQPGTGKPYSANGALSGVNISKISAPATTVVFYESEPGSTGKRYVSFADGHVESVNEKSFGALLDVSVAR